MSDAMNRPWVYCPECGLYQKDADAKIAELEKELAACQHGNEDMHQTLHSQAREIEKLRVRLRSRPAKPCEGEARSRILQALDAGNIDEGIERFNAERTAREKAERELAEARTILNIVHREHPQPNLCDACKLLGRALREKGGDNE